MVGNTFLSSCGKRAYIWIGLLVSRMCSCSCCRFQGKYALCHSDETLKDLSTHLHAITARAVLLGSHSWKFWNFCVSDERKCLFPKLPNLGQCEAKGTDVVFSPLAELVTRGIQTFLYMDQGKFPWKHKSMGLLLHFPLFRLFVWFFLSFVSSDCRKVSWFEIWYGKKMGSRRYH